MTSSDNGLSVSQPRAPTCKSHLGLYVAVAAATTAFNCSALFALKQLGEYRSMADYIHHLEAIVDNPHAETNKTKKAEIYAFYHAQFMNPFKRYSSSRSSSSSNKNT